VTKRRANTYAKTNKARISQNRGAYDSSTRGHFWVPFAGHPDEDDFRKFRQDSFTVFEDDLADVYTMPQRISK